MAQLTQYVADVSLFTPSAFADASPYLQGFHTQFEKLGWLANIKLVGAPGRVYTNFKVTLSKANRAPFDSTMAKAAIAAAIAGQSWNIRSYVEAVKEWVHFGVTVIPTAASDKGISQTGDAFKKGGQALVDAGRKSYCATIETVTGMPCWLPTTLVVMGVVGFFLMQAKGTAGYVKGALGLPPKVVTKKTTATVVTTTKEGQTKKRKSRKKGKRKK